MLVLSRKTGESILIGDIEVTITEIGKDKVKVGIKAPKECQILRKELTETIDENRQAAKAAVSQSSLAGLLQKLK